MDFIVKTGHTDVNIVLRLKLMGQPVALRLPTSVGVLRTRLLPIAIGIVGPPFAAHKEGKNYSSLNLFYGSFIYMAIHLRIRPITLFLSYDNGRKLRDKTPPI